MRFSTKSRVLIYVVYHDDKSYETCYKLLHQYPWAKFIKIPTTKYCESIMFDYLLEHQREWMIGYEFVGMITYSFNNKVEIATLEEVIRKIHQNECRDLDIIGLRGLNFSIGDVSQLGIEIPLKAVMQHFSTLTFNDDSLLGKSLGKTNNLLEKTNAEIVDTSAQKCRDTDAINTPSILVKSVSVRDIKNKMRGANESSSKALKSILQQKFDQKLDDCLAPSILNFLEEKFEEKPGEPAIQKDDRIDITEHIEKIIPFFSNYWLIRPLKLLSFLKWVKQVKTLMEENDSLNEELMKDSGYKVQSPSFEPIFNHPWMTWHPFVMERMICIFTYFSKLRLHVYKSAIKPKNNKRQFGNLVATDPI
jgi:hypothetical protein